MRSAKRPFHRGATARDGRRAFRFVPTRAHAVLDYAAGLAFLVLPSLVEADGASPYARATRAWGALGLLSGMTTKHELGLVRVVPMRVHLAVDVLGGAALAALPLVTGERDRRRWLPPVVGGALGIVLGLTTRTASTPA